MLESPRGDDMTAKGGKTSKFFTILALTANSVVNISPYFFDAPLDEGFRFLSYLRKGFQMELKQSGFLADFWSRRLRRYLKFLNIPNQIFTFLNKIPFGFVKFFGKKFCMVKGKVLILGQTFTPAILNFS